MTLDKRAKYTSWAKQVVPYLKKTIVYVNFIDDVHQLAIAIREEGFTTLAYHGKRLTAQDKKSLETWSKGQCQAMVCTTAYTGVRRYTCVYFRVFLHKAYMYVNLHMLYTRNHPTCI